MIDDCLTLKGRPRELPGCYRNDLPAFFRRLGFVRGAEIGVFKGEFAEKFCQTGLEHIAIDPWGKEGGSSRMELFYQETKDRLSSFANCSILCKTSMEALEDFPDGSLDYVYIDGSHLLKDVVADICGWSEKVRRGGVISGDDFVKTKGTRPWNSCHVAQAVMAYTDAYQIRSWYILGEKRTAQRDKARSWMWFKP